METTYTVPGMSCSHCVRTVSAELELVEAVESVAVDLDTKQVVVLGDGLDDLVLRAAIDRAGYHAV